MVALRACAETGVGHPDLWNAMLLLLHSINERLGGGEGESIDLPTDWLGETISTWVAQKTPKEDSPNESVQGFMDTLKGR